MLRSLEPFFQKLTESVRSYSDSIGCTGGNLVRRFPGIVFHCDGARRVELPVAYAACTPGVLLAAALTNTSWVFAVTGHMAANSRRIRASAQCMIGRQCNSSREDGELRTAIMLAWFMKAWVCPDQRWLTLWRALYMCTPTTMCVCMCPHCGLCGIPCYN